MNNFRNVSSLYICESFRTENHQHSVMIFVLWVLIKKIFFLLSLLADFFLEKTVASDEKIGKISACIKYLNRVEFLSNISRRVKMVGKIYGDLFYSTPPEGKNGHLEFP